MEATKKKKAYIKPRMEKFEMKMETAFLAGSKGEIIIDTPEELTMFLSPSCTSGGNGLQLDPGTCSDDITVNRDLSVNENNGCNFWTPTLFQKIGHVVGSKEKTQLRLCRKEFPDDNIYIVSRR